MISIYLLTAIGLTPGGSSTVHIYTKTVQQYSTHLHTNSTAVQYTFTHRQYSSTVHIYTQTVQQYSTHLHTNSTQNDTINFGTVQAVPRLCELYPGICLTAEGKARKNLSQDSRRVPVGTMKTELSFTYMFQSLLGPSSGSIT
jgi:gamma-glutamyltranspeptidase